MLDDHWGQIATDLEIIQTEGFAATKQVDPNMVIKKKNGEDEEVQEGWVGHIIPFELVQKTLLREEYDALMTLKDRLAAIGIEISEIIDSIPEEDRGDYLNDDNTAFVAKELATKLREIYSDIATPELTALQGYVDLLDAKAGNRRGSASPVCQLITHIRKKLDLIILHRAIQRHREPMCFIHVPTGD